MGKKKSKSAVQPIEQQTSIPLPIIGNPIRVEKQPGKKQPALEFDGTQDVLDIMRLHTGAYMKLYTNTDLIEDSGFINKLLYDFPMSEIEFRSILTFAKGQREGEISKDKKRQEAADDYCKIASEQKHGYEQAMYIRKASRQLARIGKLSSFGSVALLRMITRYSNIVKDYPSKIKTLSNRYDELRNVDTSVLTKRERQNHYRALNKTFNALNDAKEQLKNAEVSLPKLKDEFREKRMRGIQIIGESNQKGNRFFEFHLDAKKPYVLMKITGRPCIKFYVKIPDDKIEDIQKIQQMTNRKGLAVTVTATDKFIVLSYEVAALDGWILDKTDLRKKRKAIKNSSMSDEQKDEESKKVYIEYKKKQDELLASDKVRNRVLGFDSNPFFFGWAILDVDPENPEKYRIVKCGYIHWYPLYKQWLKAKTPKQHSKVYNRVRNAVMMAMSEMMKFAKHYKCEKVIMEDLDFKEAEVTKPRSTNSKTKNLWMREVANDICAKFCSRNGIKRLKINAVHTSFIGGIQNRDLPDPTAAAVEIARRGGLYYIKDTFYPRLT